MQKLIKLFNSGEQIPSLWLAVFLFCIMLTGFTVRIYNLPQRGMISRDEAWYTYSARGLQSKLLYWSSQKETVLPDTDYKKPDFEKISSNNIEGKPTYLVILWFLGKIRGVWSYENSLALSLTAGLINIPAIYLLSRKLQLSEVTGLLAALSASLSFTSIYFSRIGYPHALLITVYTFALLLYLHADCNKPLSWSLFAAGILLGFGLSIHMSLVFAIPGLWIAEVYRHRKYLRKNTGTLIRRSFLWVAGILLVLSGWELIYCITPYLFGSGPGVTSLSGSFIGDLIGHAESGGSSSNPIKNILFYGFALLGLESPLSNLFLAVGIISIWRAKVENESGKTLSLLFASYLFFLIIYPAQYGRQIAPLMSIWPIFAAVGITSFIKILKKHFVIFEKRIFAVAAVILLICLWNIYWVYPILEAKSTGWVKTAYWLKTHTRADERIYTSEISDAAILNYYLPGRVDYWAANTDEAPANNSWYVNNPTARFTPEWKTITSVIGNQQPSVIESDPWLILRPHSVMSGNWLLIPWWRWSKAPKSYQIGVDDVVSVYKIE